MSVTISKAPVADLDELLALLTSVNLPHEGVSEHINSFLVARNADGRLIGCIGLERYDRLALLRSVAVSADSQHTGIGSELTAELLTDAARAGIEEVVLLTTTARDFFSRNFGFVEANRKDYNERLANSPEWLLPRCWSAAFMLLQLKQKAHAASDEQNLKRQHKQTSYMPKGINSNQRYGHETLSRCNDRLPSHCHFAGAGPV